MIIKKTCTHKKKKKEKKKLLGKFYISVLWSRNQRDKKDEVLRRNRGCKFIIIIPDKYYHGCISHSKRCISCQMRKRLDFRIRSHS